MARVLVAEATGGPEGRQAAPVVGRLARAVDGAESHAGECFQGHCSVIGLPSGGTSARGGAGGAAKVKLVLKLTWMALGAAAYLGLAILGRGGFGDFFSHPALVALAGVLFALTGAAFFAGGNLSPGVHEDRGNRWVLPVFFVLGLLAAYLPPYADRKGFWVIDGDAVRWVGVVLFAAGGALRLWPVFVLGDRFSCLVAIQPGHTLVTGGVYGVIRHPSYLGLLVSSLGWGLTFNSWVGVLLAALLVPPLLARIRAEERLLRTQFGGAYAAYCARTSRLIPGIY
jgi:protein-S-isoprenylcysteine O-methyltransferase Ste14